MESESQGSWLQGSKRREPPLDLELLPQVRMPSGRVDRGVGPVAERLQLAEAHLLAARELTQKMR